METKRTLIKTVDEGGKVLGRIRLGTADISSDVIRYKGIDYHYFTASNDKVAKRVFEFVAQLCNWGFANKENNLENINESAVLYTNKGNAILIGEKERVPVRLLAVRFSEGAAEFYRVDHVHPNNDPNPSGTGGANGDIPEIRRMEENGIIFVTPEEDRYHIYTPKDGKYHPYNINSTIEIEPVIFYGN